VGTDRLGVVIFRLVTCGLGEPQALVQIPLAATQVPEKEAQAATRIIKNAEEPYLADTTK
jgi:hypothetical protein